MARMPYDQWEEAFIALCEKWLEEEPLYTYEHLWRKDLSPQAAFKVYLEENPDYGEKFEEMQAAPTEGSVVEPTPEQREFAELARKLEEKKKQAAIEAKMSKFCPECARVLGDKKQCKCGYRRPSAKAKPGW